MAPRPSGSGIRPSEGRRDRRAVSVSENPAAGSGGALGDWLQAIAVAVGDFGSSGVTCVAQPVRIPSNFSTTCELREPGVVQGPRARLGAPLHPHNFLNIKHLSSQDRPCRALLPPSSGTRTDTSREKTRSGGSVRLQPAETPVSPAPAGNRGRRVPARRPVKEPDRLR